MGDQRRNAGESMRAFLRVSDAFKTPATEDTYRRWAASEDTAAPLDEVLSWYGTFAAAVEVARRPPPTPRPFTVASAQRTTRARKAPHDPETAVSQDTPPPPPPPELPAARPREDLPRPAKRAARPKRDADGPTLAERRQAEWEERWGPTVTQYASEGLSIAQIAGRMRQPTSRVQRYMAKNGLSRPRGAASPNRPEPTTPGHAPDVDDGDRRPLAVMRREAWNERWSATVHRLAGEGLTQQQIAQRIGQPFWRVQQLVAGEADQRGATVKARNRDRDSQIVERWAEGRTLAEVGDEFGMTRERVRQIVARSGAQRNTTPADQRRDELFATYGARIEELVPQCTSIRELADRIPECPHTAIVEYMAKHHLRCRGARTYAKRHTDEEILEALRRADRERGPLTANSYQQWAKENGAAGPLTVSNRFGTWRAGLQRAGITPTGGGRRSYTNVWTTQRCIEAVRAWVATAPHVTATALEEARDAGAELPTRPTLRRFVGNWHQTMRCVELWQQVLNSGAMTVDDIDLSPHVWLSDADPAPVDTSEALADVTRFIDHCRSSGDHPGLTRYDRWAVEDGALPAHRILSAFGRWNEALAAAGHTSTRSSPNPKARTLSAQAPDGEPVASQELERHS